jgi:hypothetical protein
MTEGPRIFWVQWIHCQLDNYATVEDLVQHCPEAPLIDLWPGFPVTQFSTADAGGHTAAIEFVEAKPVVSRAERMPQPIPPNVPLAMNPLTNLIGAIWLTVFATTAGLRACNIPAAYPEGGLAMGEQFHLVREQATATFGAYFGQTPPGAVPVVFAPGIVSTDATNEHCAPSFSPDGNEVFWFANRWPDEGPALSMTMRRENGRWSAPRATPFDAVMAAFSTDGRRVYFGAPRPRSTTAPESQSSLDIWVVEKQGDTWSEPKCLNFVARFPELREAAMPRIARNGTLYFIGDAPGMQANHGIYRAALINGKYAKPELLPRSINLSPFLNWAPFITPDEGYLLFSSNRAGSLDEYGDIYVSRRLADGSWTDPISLGEPVNTPQQEVFPGLSPDGKYLFFCRYTPGRKNEVYWVDAATIPALQSSPNAQPEGSK